MNSDIYDDLAIEELTREFFGVHVDVEKVYVRSIPAGRNASASLFLTTKNKLYAIVTGAAPLTLGDVRKIIMRMNLKAEAYCTPRGRSNYFNDVAIEKFKAVFPGRHSASDADLRFYTLMAPYNPALVSIEEIKDGVIKQFDPTAESGWRPTAKAQYKQIRAK